MTLVTYVTHRDSRDVALGHRAVIGLFTAKGHKLLELVASGCRLASVESSSVDAWSPDPLLNKCLRLLCVHVAVLCELLYVHISYCSAAVKYEISPIYLHLSF